MSALQFHCCKADVNQSTLIFLLINTVIYNAKLHRQTLHMNMVHFIRKYACWHIWRCCLVFLREVRNHDKPWKAHKRVLDHLVSCKFDTRRHTCFSSKGSGAWHACKPISGELGLLQGDSSQVNHLWLSGVKNPIPYMPASVPIFRLVSHLFSTSLSKKQLNKFHHAKHILRRLCTCQLPVPVCSWLKAINSN